MKDYKKPLYQKRHYISFANRVRRITDPAIHRIIKEFLISEFSVDNPLFNEERFIRACTDSIKR